jgi:hypothetical protein
MKKKSNSSDFQILFFLEHPVGIITECQFHNSQDTQQLGRTNWKEKNRDGSHSSSLSKTSWVSLTGSLKRV